MTSMTNSIRIAAPAQRIYALASATERWPEILPHYRFVNVLSQDGDETHRGDGRAARAVPGALDGAAAQRSPHAGDFLSAHQRWTKGMDVVWKFDEGPDGTDVSIVHDLAFSFPVAEKAVEKYVVTGFFIDGIARRTLACMKAIAEANADG